MPRSLWNGSAGKGLAAALATAAATLSTVCAQPSLPACIRVTTSNGVACEDGTLSVMVNGNEVRGGSFQSGEQVHEQCFPAGATFQVWNPTNDGWIGRVELSHDGGCTYNVGVCTSGCDITGRSTSRMIVDGNADPCSPDTGQSYCHNSTVCTVHVPPPPPTTTTCNPTANPTGHPTANSVLSSPPSPGPSPASPAPTASPAINFNSAPPTHAELSGVTSASPATTGTCNGRQDPAFCRCVRLVIHLVVFGGFLVVGRG